MYDLLYAGQISVDTRATRRQQRVALKRLKKSNLNLRPSKIRELAKQMKKEAETQKEEADTISSGVDSGTYDLSKAESNDSDKQGMFDGGILRPQYPDLDKPHLCCSCSLPNLKKLKTLSTLALTHTTFEGQEQYCFCLWKLKLMRLTETDRGGLLRLT